MFVLGKTFQLSLIFPGKVGARDKRSSLLRKSVNYGRNKFYSTVPWFETASARQAGTVKLSTAVIVAVSE